MITQEDVQPIMLRLKHSTQDLHDATEAGTFNEELVKGRLPLERYVESLAQLFLVHRALEAHLKRHRSRVPAIDRVLRDYHLQEPYLRDDLAHFGRNPDTIAALPATTSLIMAIDRAASDQPVALLGFLYVFEGSNNGSKFISKAVRKAYSLDGAGTRYLDPYGDNQREYWHAFKADMDAAQFTPEQSQAIIHAATQTFVGVMQMHRELHAPLEQAAKPAAASAGKCPFHHG